MNWRLWKFVKKECLNAQYYENYDVFVEATFKRVFQK